MCRHRQKVFVSLCLQLSHLTQHIRAVHDGVKPFVCPQDGCHKAFPYKVCWYVDLHVHIYMRTCVHYLMSVSRQLYWKVFVCLFVCSMFINVCCMCEFAHLCLSEWEWSTELLWGQGCSSFGWLHHTSITKAASVSVCLCICQPVSACQCCWNPPTYDSVLTAGVQLYGIAQQFISYTCICTYIRTCNIIIAEFVQHVLTFLCSLVCNATCSWRVLLM